MSQKHFLGASYENLQHPAPSDTKGSELLLEPNSSPYGKNSTAKGTPKKFLDS